MKSTYFNTLNPIEKLRHNGSVKFDVYLETLGILEKWRPLIYRNRGNIDFESLRGLVLDVVMKDFNPDKGMLEPYVKRLALSIPTYDSKLVSIDTSLSEDGSEVVTTISDTLTDENKLEGFIFKKYEENYDFNDFVWSSYLDELRSWDLSEYQWGSQLVSLITSLAPVLMTANNFAFDEMAKLERGAFSESMLKVYYKTLVNELINKHKLSRSWVTKNLSLILAIYLQNENTFLTQYYNSMNSNVIRYENIKTKSNPVVSFNWATDPLKVNNMLKGQSIFRVDIKTIKNLIYDDYYSEGISNLRFVVGGREFYHVLGYMLVEGGDIDSVLTEMLTEHILKACKGTYIGTTETYVYVQAPTTTPISHYIYYFGLGLHLFFDNLGQDIEISEELLDDFESCKI